MRHKIAGNRLGRNSSLRKATIRDIARATLIHERVLTTKPKAKEARKLVDRLITMGKKGTLAHKRKAFSILCDHKMVSNLFTNTSPRFNKRPGGYTRIIPLSTRRGDNAQLAYLELTEKTEVIVSKAKSAATSKKEDLDPKETKKTASAQTTEKEVKEQQPKASTKQDPAKAHPVKDSGKDKSKPTKNIVGGLKKMFRKTPPK